MRKFAVRIAAPVAVAAALATTPLLTGTAHAGAVCTVTTPTAPLYAEPKLTGATVGVLHSGTQVAATEANAGMWRVSHADNGNHLGYMAKEDVNCGWG